MKHLDDFIDLFEGYTKAFGQYTLGDLDPEKGKRGGEARTSYTAIKKENWVEHLKGDKVGIGIVPLMDDDTRLKWACIDVDIYKDIDYKTIAAKTKHLPCVLTLSKSGGIHIWFFFNEPVNAAAVLVKMRAIAASLGFAKHEIFPKQTTRATATDTGNWINLPYFGDSRKCYKDGKQIGLAAFIKYAKAQRTTLDKFIKIDCGAQGKDFEDGPPCLQQLAFEGMPNHYNNAMTNVAVYFKHKNPDTWQTDLFDFNQRWPEPMPSTEMQKLAESVKAKGYHYTCHKPPICDYCNFQQCKQREFGITIFKGAIPIVIDSVTRYDSMPPIWVFEVEGHRLLFNDAGQVHNVNAFSKKLFEHTNRFLPPIKQDAWINYINEMTENKLTTVPAPADASNRGQLLTLLDTFINERGKFDEEQKDQMLTGNVWIDKDNVAHFQSNAFMLFLKSQGFTSLSTPEVWAILSQEGAQSGETSLKGKKISFWTYPATNLQTEEMNVKDYEDEDAF